MRSVAKNYETVRERMLPYKHYNDVRMPAAVGVVVGLSALYKAKQAVKQPFLQS